MTKPGKTDLELAASHKYRLPNGEIAVNVTTISGLLDDGKSGGMAGAAAKLTREGLNYREQWNAKRDAGTRVHDVCEKWLAGEECFVEASDHGYVDALEKFWLEHDPQMVECEAIALSNHGYGGRFDIIARVRDGRTGLVDLKTGRQYHVEHTLQLSAYRHSDGIGTYDEAGMLTDLRPMPPVDFCACLYVADDGSWELVEYPADDAAFARFLALLDVYKWTRSPEIKELAKKRGTS